MRKKKGMDKDVLDVLESIPKAIPLQHFWGVLIIRKGRRAFQKRLSESTARQLHALAQKRFGEDNAYLISLNFPIFPPKDVKPVRSQLWCPYCGTHRIYRKHPVYDTPSCIICGISTDDFHVKGTNGLWSPVVPEGRGNKNGRNSRRRERQHRQNDVDSKASPTVEGNSNTRQVRSRPKTGDVGPSRPKLSTRNIKR